MEPEKKNEEKEIKNEQESRRFFPPYRKLGHDMNYNLILTFDDEEEEP